MFELLYTVIELCRCLNTICEIIMIITGDSKSKRDKDLPYLPHPLMTRPCRYGNSSIPMGFSSFVGLGVRSKNHPLDPPLMANEFEVAMRRTLEERTLRSTHRDRPFRFSRRVAPTRRQRAAALDGNPGVEPNLDTADRGHWKGLLPAKGRGLVWGGGCGRNGGPPTLGQVCWGPA